MELKDFIIKKVLVSYFLTVTGITAAIGIIGSIFAGDTSFGYQAFLSPFLFGLVAVIPSFVTYSRKEPSPKQMLIRLIIHFLLLEALILLFAFLSHLIVSASVAISIFLSVLIIDFTVQIIHWLNDKRIAGELNKALIEMQIKNR